MTICTCRSQDTYLEERAIRSEASRSCLGKGNSIEHGQTRVSSCNIQDVVAYFDGKTEAILQRYGPGPRVHYHTGLIDNPPSSSASPKALRECLVIGQERMLFHAATSWNASSTLGGDVLDVGCGLGGGAIFWAQEFGARVTALTCVPSHANCVTRFAMEAGVRARVRPIVCDATEMSGENLFDAAVAVDSSGYLPRRAWFRRLAGLLRPTGRVFLIDCFLKSSENEEAFNRHWHTRIGTINEYLAAAQAAGLQLGPLRIFLIAQSTFGQQLLPLWMQSTMKEN